MTAAGSMVLHSLKSKTDLAVKYIAKLDFPQISLKLLKSGDRINHKAFGQN